MDRKINVHTAAPFVSLKVAKMGLADPDAEGPARRPMVRTRHCSSIF